MEKNERSSSIEKLDQKFSWWGQQKSRFRLFFRKLIWIVLFRFLAGGKRLLDILFSGILLCFSAPIFMALFIVSGHPSKILKSKTLIGKWGETFKGLQFRSDSSAIQKFIETLHLTDLPLLINIFHGELSFVGPRPMTIEECSLSSLERRQRFGAKPGLICLWWIRNKTNIGFDGEFAADIEYAESASLKGDIGIMLRAVPAFIFGGKAIPVSGEIALMDIPFKNLSMAEAIDEIIELMNSELKQQICFVNADCANIAWGHPDYMKTLRDSGFNLADGIGLKIAGNILGNEIKQNVNGTDLFPRLMERMQETKHSVYFLGAKPEVIDALVTETQKKYPSLNIAGWHHGYFAGEEEQQVINKISEARPDLLLVAFGAPKQDLWVKNNLYNLPIKIGLGVGGLFDFYSGKISRAPIWMREIGLEWLYRFIQEPTRLWKRYFIGNGIFLYHVFLVKLGVHPPSFSEISKARTGEN